MDGTITIRRAGPQDAAALALVACAGVLETYAEFIDGDDLVAFCAEHHTQDAYAVWLADPACAIWVACTVTGAVIGYLLLSPATLPDGDARAEDAEVRRIYVLAPFHRSGAGRRMMEEAVSEARERRSVTIVLGVLSLNTRALAFYDRLGFSVIAARKFQVGRTLCDDLVLAREIRDS